ncbi:SDR family oxidoreductase [Vibrio zhugei]|uniref:SDR family oxidoreductase n=1 Tax=Vibrio zhugei TaxID=2479546 RepID=A0ABV7CEB9_9VIBR|nr:SDR family oxidoreductase [Vibrio zhugei]
MKIQGAVVLITSAGSAMGRMLSQHYAELGAKLVLCDHQPHLLEETHTLCNALKASTISYTLSTTPTDDVDALLEYIEQTYQQAPDILINHWPNSAPPSLLLASEHINACLTQWGRMTNNFFVFGQRCAQRMRQSSHPGVIINTVSFNRVNDEHAMESTNAMLMGFTQSWAKELLPYQIRVGGVIPHSQSKHGQHHDYAELTRHTEYIVANDYFSGRVVTT